MNTGSGCNSGLGDPTFDYIKRADRIIACLMYFEKSDVVIHVDFPNRRCCVHYRDKPIQISAEGAVAIIAKSENVKEGLNRERILHIRYDAINKFGRLIGHEISRNDSSDIIKINYINNSVSVYRPSPDPVVFAMKNALQERK